MKILYLTSWLPFPLSTGAKVRNYNLIKYLSGNYEIDLITFIYSKEEEANISGLKNICQRVKLVRVEEKKKHSISKNIKAFLSEVPRSIKLSYSREMAELINNWVAEKKYDLIIIDSLTMAEYVLNIKNIPKLFDHHNIDAVIYERNYQLQKSLLKKIRHWFTWKKGLNYEKKVSSLIEAHVFVSHVDRNIMKKLYPVMELSEIIPNGVDLNKFHYYEYIKDEREDSVIIFSSLLKYQANIEGLRFFCEKIFPIIKNSSPDIKLIVTGDYSDLQIDDLLNDKNIEFAGYVDDVKKLIARSALTIVPLKSGSGTRFKILESMALGTPVISTTIGAEGIEGLEKVTSDKSEITSNGFNIWIEDNPEKFAEGVLNLLSNKELAGVLSRNGRRLIEERYGWNNIGKKMDEFSQKVIQSKVLKI